MLQQSGNYRLTIITTMMLFAFMLNNALRNT
jgi:hypothetical protein